MPADDSPPAAAPHGTFAANRVSVVIPAWNEAETMAKLLDGVRGALAPLARHIEIIVVVPSRDDPTTAAAEKGGARVIVQERPGYGGALREGLAESSGDYVVTMDADLSHPPATIAALFAQRDAAEVVIASRYVPGGSADMSIWREFLSRVLNAVYRRALAVPVLDMSSGFRIYQRRVLAELDLESEKYDVLEEILVKIYSLGWAVLEIPFAYQNRIAGESHANVVSFTPHFLKTLFRLWRMRNDFRSADYDSRAYDSWIPPQRMWQRRRYALLDSLAGAMGRERRLDIGCGSSRYTQHHPASVGLDIELSKLRFLRRTNPQLVRGTTFQLPFPNDVFGCVVHSQVIEHVAQDRTLFRELNRVLAPGGTLVIGTPDYGRLTWRVVEWLYKLILPNAYGDDHITHYTRHSLTDELVRHGFAVRDAKYVYGGELVLKAEKCSGLGAPPGAPPAAS